ncbi:hypothetical protein TorRG33x02_318050 [Trema orientale]|uniref:Uncharacterized protein n=1 Tax=Trema orientale TaxID=63057 RepID=A0A2P5BKH2_TREOI|nr:hypothetical protein TorRG33x02_318050 [Trema orientale]
MADVESGGSGNSNKDGVANDRDIVAENIRVENFIRNRGFSWNLSFIRNLNEWELGQILDLVFSAGIG